jgi:hypothetical protein
MIVEACTSIVETHDTMGSRLNLRSSKNHKAVSMDMSTIELEEDKDGALILACHRRVSQLSGVSEILDSIANWLDVSGSNTEPTRSCRFEDHYEIGKTLHQSEWTKIHLC